MPVAEFTCRLLSAVVIKWFTPSNAISKPSMLVSPVMVMPSLTVMAVESSDSMKLVLTVWKSPVVAVAVPCTLMLSVNSTSDESSD